MKVFSPVSDISESMLNSNISANSKSDAETFYGYETVAHGEMFDEKNINKKACKNVPLMY
jgi:hypothetical protein